MQSAGVHDAGAGRRVRGRWRGCSDMQRRGSKGMLSACRCTRALSDPTKIRNKKPINVVVSRIASLKLRTVKL